jgi:hypothetical protein
VELLRKILKQTASELHGNLIPTQVVGEAYINEIASQMGLCIAQWKYVRSLKIAAVLPT